MGNFDRGGNRGGGNFKRDNRQGGFRGGNGGGDRGTTLHRATCSDCGKSCEVPFRPTGEKPVYCNDCFGSKRDDTFRGRKESFDREPKRDFDRPAPRKEFAQGGSDETKKQLGDISAKLDKLISLFEKSHTAPMAAPAPVKAEPKAVMKKEVITKAAPKKAEKVKETKPKTAAKAPVKKVVAKKKK